ncbi:MAG: aldehyde dehydrogenase family protein, partial [Phycisphaerales bacterium]|nr:aldehyde dehydrogenase family protein [Phycisphaerales bacterium]
RVGKPYIAPHIFLDAPHDGHLATEEIFGPVLAVIRARDFDHALELANATEYKLTGGVFSRMPSHLEQAKRDFRVGNLYLNRTCTGALVGRQPFGGFGMSGIGAKAGGADYLAQFMVPRTVCENTMRRGFAPGL